MMHIMLFTLSKRHFMNIARERETCASAESRTVATQELEADEGLEYLDSGWADTRDLKRTLNGVGAIRLM